MTKKECAVIMAHTGICMLTGKDFSIFHKYIEELLGRSVYTHELGGAEIADKIKKESLSDFIKLCESAED